MKKIFTLFLLTAAMGLTANIMAQDKKSSSTSPKPKKDAELKLSADPATEEPTPLTTISFAETSFDFGKITQGDVVKHTFTFTNTGENELKLENVKPSCGCTALDWPRDPIAPGETGEIQAQFNSTGKMGKQMKYITIVYNGNPRIERVMFEGEVVPKEEPKDETEHSH